MSAPRNPDRPDPDVSRPFAASETDEIRFRGYLVDPVHRRVASPGGRVVRLEPKAFDLLLYFIENPDETLSRERLNEDVWGGKFVTDDALMVAVSALRRAFEDDPRAPKFIATIRGSGYRWIARPSIARARTRWRSIAVLSALIASGAAVILWVFLRPPEPMPSMDRTRELVKAHARGLFFSERATQAALEEARGEFRRAILIDDRFAEPHAALAEVCVRLIELGAADPEALEAEARREVARAIELAPGLAISRAALASVQFVLDRDLEAAERSFRLAMNLDPTLPGIHRRYSYLLGATSRFDAAIAEARIGAEMEPASPGAMNDLAWALLLAGRAGEAERFYREALRLDSMNLGALLSLGYCLELRAEPGAAMEAYRRVMQVRGVPSEVIAQYDALFASSGMPGVYGAWLERLEPNDGVPRMMVAFYAARAGRLDEAIDLVEESARRREPGTLWLGVHPAFAPLRGQREFDAVVASSFQTR